MPAWEFNILIDGIVIEENNMTHRKGVMLFDRDKREFGDDIALKLRI